MPIGWALYISQSFTKIEFNISESEVCTPLVYVNFQKIHVSELSVEKNKRKRIPMFNVQDEMLHKGEKHNN